MATLGQVVNKGTWSNAVTYSFIFNTLQTEVTYAGQLWITVNTPPLGTPPNLSAAWAAITPLGTNLAPGLVQGDDVTFTIVNGIGSVIGGGAGLDSLNGLTADVVIQSTTLNITEDGQDIIVDAPVGTTNAPGILAPDNNTILQDITVSSVTNISAPLTQRTMHGFSRLGNNYFVTVNFSPSSVTLYKNDNGTVTQLQNLALPVGTTAAYASTFVDSVNNVLLMAIPLLSSNELIAYNFDDNTENFITSVATTANTGNIPTGICIEYISNIPYIYVSNTADSTIQNFAWNSNTLSFDDIYTITTGLNSPTQLLSITDPNAPDNKIIVVNNFGDNSFSTFLYVNDTSYTTLSHVIINSISSMAYTTFNEIGYIALSSSANNSISVFKFIDSSSGFNNTPASAVSLANASPITWVTVINQLELLGVNSSTGIAQIYDCVNGILSARDDPFDLNGTNSTFASTQVIGTTSYLYVTNNGSPNIAILSTTYNGNIFVNPVLFPISAIGTLSGQTLAASDDTILNFTYDVPLQNFSNIPTITFFISGAATSTLSEPIILSYNLSGCSVLVTNNGAGAYTGVFAQATALGS